MKVASLFRLLSLAVLVQIALGGLVTFDFIGPLTHIAVGLVVVALAAVTVLAVFRSSPRNRSLVQVSSALVLALALQVALGFATLALGSPAVAWVHLVVGLLIYGMSMTGFSFAQMPANPSNAGDASPGRAIEAGVNP